LQGLGKKVPISLFRLLSGRNGKGVIAIKLNDGDELAAAVVLDGSVTSVDLLISSLNGMLLRVPSSQVATSSRSARGNRIVRLKPGDEVVTSTCINA
jgi:DNA gyrase/topoisomerase IV subunit A